MTSAGSRAPGQRLLTVGIIGLVTAAAFEGMAVPTVLPATLEDLGDLDLYGWAFSAFWLTMADRPNVPAMALTSRETLVPRDTNPSLTEGSGGVPREGACACTTAMQPSRTPATRGRVNIVNAVS